MRNKYSEDFEKEMIKKASTKTLAELLKISHKKYNYNITREQLRQYLYKRHIIYKDYDITKVRDMGSLVPIGSERTKPDGMIQIKITKDKWEYKQRYLYEKYHNVKFTNKDYIIFLDGDRNNFSIDNLKRVSCRVASILGNLRLPSRNKEITNLALTYAHSVIQVADLINKGGN